MANTTDTKPKLSNCQFSRKWGIHVLELAEAEGKTPEAIYSRVTRFGSPFMRRAKPSGIEKYYGKTQYELAIELGMHPLTLAMKHRLDGSVYHKQPGTDRAKGWTTTNYSWKNNPKFTAKPWLMPQHPDYSKWRSGELFSEYHIEKPADY